MFSLAGFYGLVTPERSSIQATKTVWKLFETTFLCALTDFQTNEAGSVTAATKRSVCPPHSPHVTAAVSLCQGIKLTGCWPCISRFKISARVRYKYFNNLFEVQLYCFLSQEKEFLQIYECQLCKSFFKKSMAHTKKNIEGTAFAVTWGAAIQWRGQRLYVFKDLPWTSGDKGYGRVTSGPMPRYLAHTRGGDGYVTATSKAAMKIKSTAGTSTLQPIMHNKNKGNHYALQMTPSDLFIFYSDSKILICSHLGHWGHVIPLHLLQGSVRFP